MAKDAKNPESDRMLIIGDSIRRAETLIRLSIDPKMAGLPYTTKCSPNSIIFAGAEARLKLNHTKRMEAYPTTELESPVTSPLVAYLSNSPLLAPSSRTAVIVDAIAPYPHADT